MWCHWGSNSVGTSRTEGRALTNCANCVLLLSQLFPTVSVCISKLGNIREIKWTDSSFHQQKINEKESHEVLNILFFFFSLFFFFPFSCSQVPCPPGWFSPNGLVPCSLCDRRSFQPQSESRTCVQCPGTTVTTQFGSKRRQNCQG